MPFNDRLEERSYLLPKRVSLALTVVEVIAEDKYVTVQHLMDVTEFSRAYVMACCLGLKRYGILVSKRGAGGGYSLAREPSEITVGEVLEAISKAEDRSVITVALYRFLVGKAKDLTIAQLISESF